MLRTAYKKPYLEKLSVYRASQYVSQYNNEKSVLVSLHVVFNRRIRVWTRRIVTTRWFWPPLLLPFFLGIYLLYGAIANVFKSVFTHSGFDIFYSLMFAIAMLIGDVLFARSLFKII